jgi:hypothetical protein
VKSFEQRVLQSAVHLPFGAATAFAVVLFFFFYNSKKGIYIYRLMLSWTDHLYKWFT